MICSLYGRKQLAHRYQHLNCKSDACTTASFGIAMQAARQTAEQRSTELSIQVDKLTQQAVESATDAQRSLNAAIQKAAKDSEIAQANS